jgi:hypothetical protein
MLFKKLLWNLCPSASIQYVSNDYFPYKYFRFIVSYLLFSYILISFLIIILYSPQFKYIMNFIFLYYFHIYTYYSFKTCLYFSYSPNVRLWDLFIYLINTTIFNIHFNALWFMFISIDSIVHTLVKHTVH